MEKKTQTADEIMMKTTAISDRTRDYISALDKVSEIWGILNRILERDCRPEKAGAEQLREKIADAMNKISDFLLCTIVGQLNLLDMIIEDLTPAECPEE